MSMCDEHFIVPGTNKKKDQFITHAHTHTHTPNEHHWSNWIVYKIKLVIFFQITHFIIMICDLCHNENNMFYMIRLLQYLCQCVYVYDTNFIIFSSEKKTLHNTNNKKNEKLIIIIKING